ncbi:MAG: DUF2029 domain-containing protein [Rhodobacteraceae bacterium]|nr:DUF2029 domain-containing protein [Paracoccaceae bacterium]
MTRSATQPPRFLPALSARQDSILALLFLALWSAATIVLQWDIWPEDLSALYIAGALWQQGQPDLIYATPFGFYGGTAAEWIPIQQQLGIYDLGSFPYVYPPLWAVLTAPLTAAMSPQGFANAVTCVQVPMLAASAFLAMRILPLPGAQLWLKSAIGVALLSTMIPAYTALWFNNPSITVNFLTLLAFERLGARRPVAAGAALALAASIKLSPAAFVLVFLIDRQWRALASFAAIGGGLGLLSLALAGWPLHGDFLASLRAVADTALLSAGNVSLRAALPALASGLSLAAPIPTDEANHIIQTIPGWFAPLPGLAGAALMIAFGLALRDLQGPLRRGFGLLALSIIVPLFGPLGWLHYYVLPMLLLPGIIAVVPLRRSLILFAALGLPSLTVVFAEIGRLPWPSADYVWLMSALWLALLAALLTGLRRLPAGAK